MEVKWKANVDESYREKSISIKPKVRANKEVKQKSLQRTE